MVLVRRWAQDNGAYAGSTSGTVQELLEWIHDSSKWVVDDSRWDPRQLALTSIYAWEPGSFPTIPTSFQVAPRHNLAPGRHL